MGLGLICRRSRVHLRPSVWFLGSINTGPFRNSHHELFYTPSLQLELLSWTQLGLGGHILASN